MEPNEVEEQGESHIKELSDEYTCDLISKGEVISTPAVNLKPLPFPNQKRTTVTVDRH
jgi:hypothetical protein